MCANVEHINYVWKQLIFHTLHIVRFLHGNLKYNFHKFLEKFEI